MMEEEEKDVRHSSRPNGHFQLYLYLEPGRLLEVSLLSKLDDGLWHARFTPESLPESCQNVFGDLEGLFDFLQEHGSDPEKTAFSDTGLVVLTEHLPMKSKLVKVGA
jgi:hypothetical protein